MIKLNSKYDIVVVGAGPVGIYASIQLAKNGLRVLVIEEDSHVGKPRFCTGIISKEAFDKFNLPKEAIENQFCSARIFSPLGSTVRLKSDYSWVYVTDRAVFDHALYEKAKEKGVEFLLDCRCLGLKINDSSAQTNISLDGKEIAVRSEMLILATGVKYNLHKDIGLSGPSNLLNSAQVQVCGKSEGEIEIFMGNSVAPHSFAWIVPLKENKLRIGLSTHRNSVHFLRSFLDNLKSKNRILKEDSDIMNRTIPLGPIKTTFAHRVLVVGDAAGQVKPTTGGGIYFGLLCADLAAETIVAAFNTGDFSENYLHRYEISWKRKIEFDLTMGLYLRKLIAHFNDEQIEKLVRFCSQNPIQRLIEKHADFDNHGIFVRELIKKPEFWKIIYQILSAK